MAAIAERYWSPAATTDAVDMYRRLDVVGQRLGATGIVHRANYEPMLERLTSNRPVGELRRIVDLVEPVKDYNRGRRAKFTTLTPLVRLVDAARPESDEARAFGGLVDTLLADPAKEAGRDAIRSALEQWQEDAAAAEPLFRGPLLQDAAPVVQGLKVASALGLKAIDAIGKKTPLTLTVEESDALARSVAPAADVLLMVAPHVKKLVDAAK